MRIDSIRVSMPSRKVDNDEILALVRQHSEGSFDGDLEQALGRIGKVLQLSGARSRRWPDTGEKPIDHIRNAIDGALADAKLDKADVDLLMYIGVDKGFIEPGQSYMVAHALGMDRVECFDVLDACMSWARAMHIAETFLAAGHYRRILIVGAEFNTLEGGSLRPCNYRLDNIEQLYWTFAGYTIGSAATATLVSADADKPWTWRLTSRPDLAALCTIPSFGLGQYSADNDMIGKNGPFRFTSYGQELHRAALEPCVELMRELLELHPDIAHVFPHASSYKEWEMFASEAGVSDKIRHIYPDYGNLVSVSVPAGLALALSSGQAQRGQRLAGWVGSAGMSFAAFSFEL